MGVSKSYIQDNDICGRDVDRERRVQNRRQEGVNFGGEEIESRVIDVRKSEAERPNKAAKMHAQKKKKHTIKLVCVLHGEVLQ